MNPPAVFPKAAKGTQMDGFKRNTLFGLAVLAGAGHAGEGHAQSGRPVYITDDRQMAAFIDGSRCADSVRTVFKAKAVSAFESGQPVAARLMNNVVALLKAQCPQLTHVSAKGTVEDDIVYTGLAEKSTGWTVVELGAGQFSGTGETGKKAEFQSRPDFLPYAELLPRIGEKTTLCSDLQADSCTSVTELVGASESGATVQATSLFQDQAQAIVRFPAQEQEGFLCSDPNTAEISVSGGTLSPSGRQEMEQLLRERWLNSGDLVCLGYAYPDGGLSGISFNGEGDQLTSEVEITPFRSAPGLRLES